MAGTDDEPENGAAKGAPKGKSGDATGGSGSSPATGSGTTASGSRAGKSAAKRKSAKAAKDKTGASSSGSATKSDAAATDDTPQKGTGTGTTPKSSAQSGSSESVKGGTGAKTGATAAAASTSASTSTAKAGSPSAAGDTRASGKAKDTSATSRTLEAPKTAGVKRPDVTDGKPATRPAEVSGAAKERPAGAASGSGHTPAATPGRTPATESARKGGFLPLLLGGILAGAIGFGAAWYVFDSRDTGLSEQLAAQEQRLAAAESQLAGRVEGATVESVSQLEERLAASEEAAGGAGARVEEAIASQNEVIENLAARIDTLEKAPVEASEDPAARAALEAYGREVETLRQEVAAQVERMNAALEAAKETEAVAARRQEEAEAAAVAAAEQRALMDVLAALESGAAYAEPLDEIVSVEIPDGLVAPADEGVATLDELRASYPAAAREALRTGREETAGESGGGLGSWVTRQLGARSLEPKEGNDADAVLSRAEAALSEGNLGIALEELTALPPGAQDVLAEWTERARRRHDAVTGAAALSETLASN